MEKNKIVPKQTIPLRQRIEEFINKNPSVIKKIPPIDIRNLFEDLQIYQLESEKYNDELLKTQAELHETVEKYRSLVDDSIDGIAVVQGLEIKFVNSALIKMFGCQNEKEMVGHLFTEFVAPEDRDLLVRMGMDREAGKRVSGRYEFKALHKDGIKFDAGISVSLITYQGNPARQGVIRDISQEKKAQEALRKSERRFRNFLDKLGDAAYETDSSGNITYANKMSETITGMPLKDIIGKPFLPLFTEESQKIAIDVYHKTLNGESPEYDLTFTNGSICHFKNEPLKDEDGKIIGVFGIARDITDRKQAEEALKKAHDELEQQVKERTRELEIKTKSLEELNAAMEVLLKKRAEDKTAIEDNALTNVKKLIQPYFKKIKKTKLDDQQKVLISILESNLNEIISPFIRKLSLKYLSLTPKEIQIVNLIKHGYATKKIAKIMNISPRTVDTHRKNIRKKIGLYKKRANLRSHLLSIH